METKAIILMILTELIITVITARFFWKVLFAKPNPEPDSYSENDEQQR